MSMQCAFTLDPRRVRSIIRLCMLSRKRLIVPEAPPLKSPKLRSRGRIAMASTDDGSPNVNLPTRSEVVAQFQSIIADSANSVSNRWEKCWKTGVTPWDVGSVTPIIQFLVDKGELPNGTALVPGCGSGYDVLALASDARRVVGLDLSETVNKISRQIAEESPKGQWVQFLVADFFDYVPESPFDLIFDYTFFCAIDPTLRSAWASKMTELLTSDGELITLMFPVDDYDGGPPYSVSIKEYADVLNPQGFTMTSCEDNELAVGGRKGREKLARWKRENTNSKI